MTQNRTDTHHNATSAVTVIIPARNAAATLPRTLDSLLLQTFTGWTCIVVDSRSTDSTAEVVKTYIDRFPHKFALESVDHKGPFAARLHGLKMCRTQWVMMADADDTMPPNAIQSLLDLADDETDMVVGGVEISINNSRPRNIAHGADCAISGRDFSNNVLGSFWLWAIYGRLIRTRKIDFASLEKARVMLGIMEDAAMNILIGLKLRRVRLAPNIIAYNYFRGTHGISSTYLPTATEFTDFCEDITEKAGDTPQINLQLHRYAYELLLARGIHIDRASLRHIRNMGKKARKDPSFNNHDRVISAALTSKHLRRAMANRHIACEANFTPMFSIIVSAYNKEHELKRSIDSIRKHNTFNRYEIIIVDDGSTDSTLRIAKQLADGDPRIRVVAHNTNRGLNTTRFTGIENARAQWILFFDVGDIMMPETLNNLHAHINNHGKNCDVVIFGIDMKPKLVPITKRLWNSPRQFLGVDVPSENLFPIFLRGNTFPHAMFNKAYRKELFLRAKLSPVENFYGEDYLTTIKLFHQKFNCSFAPFIGYKYLLGGGSHLSPQKQWESNCALASETLNLLNEMDIATDENTALVAECIHSSLLENLSRIISKGKSTDEKLTPYILQFTANPMWLNLREFLPDSTLYCGAEAHLTIASESRENYRKHRKFFIFRRFFD